MNHHKKRAKGTYLLEKFPGKGGWTYAAIPEITQDTSNPFGWVEISGHINTFQLSHYKLMPMGKGQLFLPVRAAIRKKIKKEAGDWVEIDIYVDESPIEIPEEIMICFEYESAHLKETFLSFTPSEQKAYLDWIYSAKTEDTKTKRLLEMMLRLEKGVTLHKKLP